MNPIPNYKDIIDLIKKGATLEAQEKIMELREAALSLQEENLQMQTTIKELEEKMELRDKMKWEKPFYWIESEGRKDGPYCQRCYDKAELLMRIIDHRNGIWSCPECKTTYDDGSYRAPKGRVERSF